MRPVLLSFADKIALGAVLVAMIALPLIYLGLIAFAAALCALFQITRPTGRYGISGRTRSGPNRTTRSSYNRSPDAAGCSHRKKDAFLTSLEKNAPKKNQQHTEPDRNAKAFGHRVQN